MNESKRNVVKSLIMAGATGTVWKQPVVESIILPAHAITTCMLVQIPEDAIVNPGSPLNTSSGDFIDFNSGGNFTHNTGFATVAIRNGSSLEYLTGIATIYVEAGSSINISTGVLDIFAEPDATVTGNVDGSNIITGCLEFSASSPT